MKQFLRSLPLLNVSLMLMQFMIGILSIPIAMLAALVLEPVSNATHSAAGFGASAGLACLLWQFAAGLVRAEEGRLETAAYMCTMAAILFLGTLVLAAVLPMIADIDENASIMAYWLTKGLWYMAVLYVETGCLLLCWTADLFIEKSNGEIR